MLGRVTELLSVLDLSMPGPPSPNAWGDQEDRPCPRAPRSAILVRQVWRGAGGRAGRGVRAWHGLRMGLGRRERIQFRCAFSLPRSQRHSGV